jgi:uncharacterized protein (DUF433 family)
MGEIGRITADPRVMGGRATIRGMRVTVSNVLDLLAAGHSHQEILGDYPYLEPEDIEAALEYASWRMSEYEVPLQSA